MCVMSCPLLFNVLNSHLSYIVHVQARRRGDHRDIQIKCVRTIYCAFFRHTESWLDRWTSSQTKGRHFPSQCIGTGCLLYTRARVGPGPKAITFILSCIVMGESNGVMHDPRRSSNCVPDISLTSAHLYPYAYYRVSVIFSWPYLHSLSLTYA